MKTIGSFLYALLLSFIIVAMFLACGLLIGHVNQRPLYTVARHT